MTTALLVPQQELPTWKARTCVEKFSADDMLHLESFADRPGRLARRLASAERADHGELTGAAMKALGLAPFEVAESDDNLLVNAGITLLLNLLIGAGGTTYAAANARLGAGDGGGSVPTAAATDTGLTAVTNRYFQLCSSSTVSAQTLTIVSTFPTGQANYVWNEWCTDENTEILTAHGWRRYDEIAVGDEVLVLDPETLCSRWEPLLNVNIWPERPRMMRLMEGVGHSSLTTMDHRWLVRQQHSDGPRMEWRTTEALNSGSSIPRAVPHLAFPSTPKYGDEFCQAVAWYWTEGWEAKRDRPSRTGYIGQSGTKNPAHVASIRAALTAAFPGGWTETVRPDGMVHFRLSGRAMDALSEVQGAHKAPTPEFLRSMTRAQLGSFIDACLDGDGHRSPVGQVTWYQVEEESVRIFEMACALAGIPTNTTLTADHENRYGRPTHRVALLHRDVAKPVDAARQSAKGGGPTTDLLVPHDGVVWCPTTPSGTWLARRRGSVYFTGNCIDNGGASSATPAGTSLNHKGVNLGTKTSAASWQFTVTVTVS